MDIKQPKILVQDAQPYHGFNRPVSAINKSSMTKLDESQYQMNNQNIKIKDSSSEISTGEMEYPPNYPGNAKLFTNETNDSIPISVQ